jgi:hypothetical protein
MPEKVRVSPATALQLSTGGGQAALEPEDDDELLEDEDDPEDPVDDDPEDVDEEDEDEDEPDDEDDDSAFAGAEPLPDDRLSVR